MTPFGVYLLMMADSVCTTLTLITIACGVGVIFLLLGILIESDGYCDNKEIVAALKPWTRRLLIVCAVSLGINTFMPDTKTLAAMYVLPKLTTPHALDTMSKDGQQLYDLTIAALKHMAGEAKDSK